MPENLQLFDSKEYQKARYALALINIKSLGVKTFTYSIPDDLKDKIQIGQAILVPFGRQGYVNAFCVGFTNYVPDGIRVSCA